MSSDEWIKERVEKIARLPVSVLKAIEQAMREAQERGRDEAIDKSTEVMDLLNALGFFRRANTVCELVERLTWMQERFCGNECPDSGAHIDVCISTRRILAQFPESLKAKAKDCGQEADAFAVDEEQGRRLERKKWEKAVELVLQPSFLARYDGKQRMAISDVVEYLRERSQTEPKR